MSRVKIAAVMAFIGAGLAVALAVLPAQSQASPIYVDIAAAGANDGSSWADAYTDLQDALAAATSGDDILIAEGTYRPTAPFLPIEAARSVSFEMIDGVDLHGGYPTGGGTPNPDRHRTILSGDLNADDYSSDLLGLSADNAADNSLHVVTADDSVVSGTTIEGVTITGGRANGPVDIPNRTTGGGVLSDGATLVIADSVIRGNLAGVPGVDLGTPGVNGRGAGVAAIGGSLTIRDSLIADNWLREGVQGGGLTAVDATAAVTSSVVRGNSPSGVHNIDGTLTITASVVSETLGYGVVNEGGAATIVGSAVERNHGAVNSSGFIGSPGGGVFDDGGQSMTIVGSTIRNNFTPADGGGVVFFSTSSATIDTSLITGNRAGAATVGGTGGDGGGVFDASLASTITGSVIAGNTATNSGGIYGVVGTSMSNSIVYGNGSPGITLASGGTATVNHSLVEGWVGGGTGNIDADPLFAGPGDYRLQPGSPAREAGDNAAVPADTFDVDGDGDTAEPTPDLDDRARIHGVVDMGAYETPVPGDTFPGLTIDGPTGTLTASTEGATAEPSEPDDACGLPIAPLESIWFTWTAPSNDEIAFDTFGSDFNSYLHVYEGTAVDALTEIGCSDKSTTNVGGDDARVIFTPTAGSTYRIRVDGWGQTDGTVTLNWGEPPVIIVPDGTGIGEGDSGTKTALLPVNLTKPAPGPITVRYASMPYPQPGFAEPGIDYVPTMGVLTFDTGDTTGTVPLDIIGDTDDEPPLYIGEWALIRFEGPQGAELDLRLFGLGIVVIIDDDP